MELPSALFLVFLLVLKLQVFLHLQCLRSETLALYNYNNIHRLIQAGKTKQSIQTERAWHLICSKNHLKIFSHGLIWGNVCLKFIYLHSICSCKTGDKLLPLCSLLCGRKSIQPDWYRVTSIVLN